MVNNREENLSYDFKMRLALVILFLTFGFVSNAQEDKAKAYVLKSIYFGGGSYFINEEQIVELNHLIDSIPNVRDYTITIHSHTDNIGGAEYNEWLSQMRSESVIQELLLSEFSMSQIEIRDFGQFNPVYDNSTWEGRLRNRRVDIIFWPIVF